MPSTRFAWVLASLKVLQGVHKGETLEGEWLLSQAAVEIMQRRRGSGVNDVGEGKKKHMLH